MFKYVLEPKEGYSLASIILRGANVDNAVIAVLDKRTEVKVAEIPATDIAIDLLKPEMPKVIFEAMFGDGSVKDLGTSWEEDVLYGGSNPFDQMIVKIVREHGKITEEEVITKIIKDYALCRDTKKNREFLSGRILRLRNMGILNLKYGYLELGVAKLPKNDIKTPLEIGYNPIMKRMFDFVEAFGSVEIRRLELHMIYELRWIESKEEFDKYLELMIERGYFNKVNEFEVTVEKPIEPNR